MSAPIIAFFNPAGGVGATTHVYHLAWMFSDLGLKVLAADLDPQANLTELFLDRYALETSAEDALPTIYRSAEPLIVRRESLYGTETWPVGNGVSLLPGDLRLSIFEELFASEWYESKPECVVTSSFWRILTEAATNGNADVTLVDLGPDLSAVNRAALLASDYLVVPLAADRSSRLEIRILGEALQNWKMKWAQRRGIASQSCPAGDIDPIGYVVQPRPIHLSYRFRVHEDAMNGIPIEFQRFISSSKSDSCLGLLKHYHSLMEMAQQAQKPMFHLTMADGAIGSHLQAAQRVAEEYKLLAERIAQRIGLKLPYLSGSVA